MKNVDTSANKSKQSIKKTEEDTEKKEPEEGKLINEEEMLDIAEHCFIKIAECMIEKNKSVRTIFTKYSIPE